MRSLRMKMVMIMVILILALMLTTGAFLMSGVCSGFRRKTTPPRR